MPSQQPYLFTNIEALDATTELYTQRRRSDLPPGERKFTLTLLVTYLVSFFGFVRAPLQAAITVTGSEEVTVPAGSLLTHIVCTGSAGPVKAGITDGGGELMDDVIGTGALVYNTSYFFATESTLWLTGTFTARLYFR